MNGDKNIEVKKIKLTTLSPVFIGGGVTLNKSQYIYRRGSDKIYILDEGKFSDFLFKGNLFDRYFKFVEKSSSVGDRKDLINWMSESGISEKDYCNFTRYVLDFELKNLEIDKESLNDIHCFIKNTSLKPYIPGSSIKGAIRTAILFRKIRNDRNFGSYSIKSEIEKALISGKKQDIDRINKKIERNIFEYKEYEKDGDKNHMHGISISDSAEIPEKNLELIQKLDLSTKYKNGNYQKKLPLYREYLKPLTETTFTISIDRLITSPLGVESISDIFECLNEFNAFIENHVNSKFIKFNTPFSNSYNKLLKPTICIGGGAGMFSKVVTYAILGGVEEASKSMKVYLNKNFRVHKHNELDKNISPRTLKLSRCHETNLLVGWCNLEEVTHSEHLT